MTLDRELFLAYVEEDNIQRAYFRVHPILTVNGPAAEEGASLWPDEGCLRIVPDRGEQHTFKDRMRKLNGWCVVDLTAFNPEADKIRTNKNYHPDRGETNRYILYSDAVHSVCEDVFHEIIAGKADDAAALAEAAVTPVFYIRDEDTIYGPVNRENPSVPGTAPEMEAVFHSIACPDGKQHDFLCVQAEYDARPRVEQAARPSRKRPAEAEAAAPAAEAAVSPAAEEKHEPAEAGVQETAAEPEVPKPAPEAQEDAPIVIGEPLKILDENRTFEETLSGLNQPLSGSANLLKGHAAPVVQQPKPVPQQTGKLSGTPLVRGAAPVVSNQARNRVQEVVYNQCRVARNEAPADELPKGVNMRRTENPVEEAASALRKAWGVYEAREQVLEDFLTMDGVQSALERRLARKIGVTDLQKAITEHLHTLEAERLSVLVELDHAKSDFDAYRREVLSKASAKATAELTDLEEKKAALSADIDAVKDELNRLNATRGELTEQIEGLSRSIPQELAKLLAGSSLRVPDLGETLTLAPVSGDAIELEELLARVSKVCRASGVESDRNSAIALLLALAGSKRIGIAAQAEAAVCTYLQNIAHIMGWDSSFAIQQTHTQRAVLYAAPRDAAPAILTTAVPSFAAAEGLCKLILTARTEDQTGSGAYRVGQWPVLPVAVTGFVSEYREGSVRPVSADSLKALLAKGAVPAETVRQVLKPALNLVPPLSGSAMNELCAFVSAAAGLMEGGLTAACDWAIQMWVLPNLRRTSEKLEAAKLALTEYPLSSAKL